jgi:dihydrofolate reductase
MVNFVILVAASHNNVIGVNNQLPWNIPSDLARFKRITVGKTILMGKNTFNSLPITLKDREIIVLSKTMNPKDYYYGDNVTVISSVSQLNHYEDKTIYVCGGSRVYNEMLDSCNKVLLTRVQTVIEDPNANYFPRLQEVSSNWHINSVDFPLYNQRDQYPTSYIEYSRRPKIWVVKA